jgi:hypothetical protein
MEQNCSPHNQRTKKEKEEEARIPLLLSRAYLPMTGRPPSRPHLSEVS